MAWGLEEDNGEIFVIINGKKAASENLEEFGPVEYVNPGRSADELWIRFAGSGSKNGIRLLRSHYSPCSENPDLKDLAFSHSNADFIKKLDCFSIGKKKSTRGKKKQTKSRTMPEASGMAPPDDTVLSYEQGILQEKMIGRFKLKEKRLSIAPEEYRCRNIDAKWVATLKKSMRQAPGSIITTLPALIDPAVVKDPAEFHQEQMEDFNISVFLLGGNHLITACRELIQEEPENEILSHYQDFEVELYVGLTQEEAKLAGNIHNSRCSTKTLNFQDQVRQARAVYVRDEAGDQWKDTARVILSHIQQKKCQRNGLSVVFGVASYSEETYKEAERVFELFGSLDVPQQLFKTLLGFNDEVALQYLRRVEIRQDCKKITEIVIREKKRCILQNVFLQRTNCSSWEEAEEQYEPYVSVIDDYIDINVNRKNVPSGFIVACDSARDNLPAQHIKVEVRVDIHVDGEEMDADQVEELCGLEKRKLQNVVELKVKKMKY